MRFNYLNKQTNKRIIIIIIIIITIIIIINITVSPTLYHFYLYNFNQNQQTAAPSIQHHWYYCDFLYVLKEILVSAD
jgi:uncharacterized protein YpmB